MKLLICILHATSVYNFDEYQYMYAVFTPSHCQRKFRILRSYIYHLVRVTSMYAVLESSCCHAYFEC